MPSKVDKTLVYANMSHNTRDYSYAKTEFFYELEITRKFIDKLYVLQYLLKTHDLSNIEIAHKMHWNVIDGALSDNKLERAVQLATIPLEETEEITVDGGDYAIVWPGGITISIHGKWESYDTYKVYFKLEELENAIT